MVHKDKLWIKFKDLDIECFCAYNDRRCTKDKRKGCGLYLVKFIQLDDEEQSEKLKKASSSLEAQFKKENKRFESELKKSIDKLKRFKI